MLQDVSKKKKELNVFKCILSFNYMCIWKRKKCYSMDHSHDLRLCNII